MCLFCIISESSKQGSSSPALTIRCDTDLALWNHTPFSLLPSFRPFFFPTFSRSSPPLRYGWTKENDGMVLSGFFWGYLFSQIIGGWCAARFGGKKVLLYSMVLCSLLTVSLLMKK